MKFPTTEQLYEMDFDSLIIYIGDLESKVIKLEDQVKKLKEKVKK